MPGSGSGYNCGESEDDAVYDPDTGCQIKAGNVEYDSRHSGLPCSNVQCAIDVIWNDGEPGKQGPPGEDGSDGIDGTDGADSTVPGPVGPIGDTGPAGPEGPASTVPGPEGPQGIPGNDGLDSTVPGPIGPEGPQGLPGEVEEAPLDGQAYNRLSGAWAVDTGGGDFLPLAGGIMAGTIDMANMHFIRNVPAPSLPQDVIPKAYFEAHSLDTTTNPHNITAAQLGVVTGFKNVLINGDFRVNQRSFDGDWSLLGEGLYGYDRWKKVGTDIVQVIEPENLITGEAYTLTWDGGGNGVLTIAGTGFPAAPSPVILTQAGDVNSGVNQVIVPNTATNVQLERGLVQTSFELRNIQQELAMCQRYYYQYVGAVVMYAGAIYNSTSNLSRSLFIPWPERMRVSPVVTSTKSNWDAAAEAVNADGVRFLGNGNAATSAAGISALIADAEL